MTIINRAARLAILAGCSLILVSCSDAGPNLSAPSAVPAPPPGNPTPPELAGDYAISFVAQNCDAGAPAPPPAFRSRTYRAQLEQDGTSIRVVMTGLPLIFDLRHSTLWGQVQPDNSSVTLTNYWGNDQWDALFEQVGPTNLLSILVDDMRLRVSPEGLSGGFTGQFLIYDGSEGRWPHISSGCWSSSHSVTFTR